MNASRALQSFVRIGFIAVAACALFVVVSEVHAPQVSYASSTVPNLARSCFDVMAFGADPTGTTDSTKAFQDALLAASLQNGAAVCAPAGTFKISRLTIYSSGTGSSVQGGPSLYGAGPGVTVLLATGNGDVFDSCPGYGNLAGATPPPPLCPSPLPTYPVGTPDPSSLLNGVVLSNFSIMHSPAPSGSPATDFSFPYVQGLLVDNVCVSNSNNVFDLGERTSTASYGSVTIRDSSCGYSYTGHFLALHGSGSNISVHDNSILANSAGIVLDTSDVTDGASGTVSSMSWVGNTIEQPIIGMFQFAGVPQTGSGITSIASSQWKGNVYDGCVLACYYFGLDPNAVATPLISGLKVSDRSAISRYDALYVDGGTAATSGIQGIEVGGPSFYSGSNGGTAGTLFMLRGTPSAGDIWVVWSSMPSNVTHYIIGSADTANSIATAIGRMTSSNPIAKPISLANPGYGIVGASLPATPSAGSYTAMPYTVIINSTGLTAIGIPAASAMCTPPGLSTGYPCWNGAFDVGDGAAIRNDAHDIDIVGARLTSQAGAAIHVWPNGGDQLHFLKNVLGVDQGVTSFTGLQFDSGTLPFNYYVDGNDFVGAATPIANAMPTPAFVSDGSAPAARGNRGAFGYALAPSPVSTNAAFNIKNSGPFDCVYYFNWSPGSATTTLTLPGGTGTVTLPPLPPAQITLPVGAEFTASGIISVTYNGFCQP